MKPFELHIARSLPDALDYLWRFGDETAVLAGGTDLIIRIRSGRESPARVLDISRLSELRVMEREGAAVGVAVAGDAGPTGGPAVMRLGALVTHAMVADSPETRADIPLLAEACATIGSPQIRNIATLGGNCVTASRAGDSLPALLALDAEMVLVSLAGERRVPMAEWFTAPRTTARRPDELLSYILVPVRRPGERFRYFKLSQRRALAISVISVAFRLRMEEEGGTVSGTVAGGVASAAVRAPAEVAMAARPRCLEAAVAFGNLAPVVIRARTVEAALAGRVLDEATIARAAEVSLDEIAPRDDVRASAEYRRAMVQALVRRGLDQLAGQATPVGGPGAPAGPGGRRKAPAAGPAASGVGPAASGVGPSGLSGRPRERRPSP